MSWIQTYTGLAFDVRRPMSCDIRIEDIAHALSNLCRFGGHCRRFYSVAEHSVHVSYLVPPEHAFAALLHDATEAYCVDVPRPIKELLPGYREIESGIWAAIAKAYDLPLVLPECIKEADNAMLLAERDALLDKSPAMTPAWAWAAGLTPANRAPMCLAPHGAKEAFLARFEELL